MVQSKQQQAKTGAHSQRQDDQDMKKESLVIAGGEPAGVDMQFTFSIWLRRQPGASGLGPSLGRNPLFPGLQGRMREVGSMNQTSDHRQAR